MTKSYGLVILLLIIPAAANSAEIENFRAGLACTDGETFGWICHQTEKIFITGQSKCEYDGDLHPCTWHGIQFDYINVTEDTVIECTVSTPTPIAVWNPQEETRKWEKKVDYRLPVPIGDGNFYYPQYHLLALAPDDARFVTELTICYSNGKKLAEFTQEYVYPRE